MTRNKPESHYYLYLYAVGAFVVASAALWTARHRPAVQQFINQLNLPTDNQNSSPTLGDVLDNVQAVQNNQSSNSQSATDSTTGTSDTVGALPSVGYFPMFAFAYESGSQRASQEYVAASDAETVQALLMLENEALASQQQQQAQSVAAQQIEALTPTVKAGK